VSSGALVRNSGTCLGIIFQSLWNVFKSFARRPTVIWYSGFWNRLVASSSPACCKYRLELTRAVGSEILRNFLNFFIFLDLVISNFVHKEGQYLYSYYPSISNSHKLRPHPILKSLETATGRTFYLVSLVFRKRFQWKNRIYTFFIVLFCVFHTIV